MKTQRHIIKWVLVLVLVFALTGCENEKNSEQAVVVINGEEVASSEIMIYLLQVKASFEEVGGVEVWDYEDFSGGKTAEEVAKEGALESLIKVKILDGKAKEMDISLTESVIEETELLAKNYFELIPKDVITEYEITKEIVIKSFKDFRLANEVTQAVSDNFFPTNEQIEETMLENEDYAKVSLLEPQEALTIAVVKQIITSTSEVDASGTLVPLSEEIKQDAYTKILEAYDKAIAGEDFDQLVEVYSEDEDKNNNNGEYKFRIALLDENLKSVLEDLEIGDISDIAQSEYGYHFFKLLDIVYPTKEEIANYEVQFKQLEEKLRLEAEDKIKDEAFNEIYEEWKAESTIVLDKDHWDLMKLVD